MTQRGSSDKGGSKEIIVAIIGAVSVLAAAIIGVIPNLIRSEAPAPPLVIATLSSPTPLGPTVMPASATVVPSPTTASKSVAGIWEGEWSSPEGYLYAFHMKLDAGTANSLSGSIVWTLKKAPPDSDEANLIGSQATEFVEGSYHSESCAARFEGQRKDDPDDIIDVDVYRVRLSEDGNTFNGESFTGGTWEGKLVGKRVK